MLPPYPQFRGLDRVSKGKLMSIENEAPVAAPEATEPAAPEAASATESKVEASEEVSAEEEAELSADSEQAGKEASEKLTKAEKKEAERLFELKVNGKKLSVNQEELIRRAQKAEAAEEKFQKASQIEKQASQLVELLKTNPLAILKNPNLGIDIKQLAQQIYEEELREAEKSPEQKEKERLQSELEEIKRKYEEEMTRRQQEEYDRIVAQQEKEITDGIINAIESSNLPKSEYIVKRMTDIMLVAHENGIELNPKDVVPILRKELKSELSRIPPEVLEEFIGEESVKGLRKRYVSKLKAAQTPATQAPTKVQDNSKAVAQEKPAEKVAVKDFFKNLK